MWFLFKANDSRSYKFRRKSTEKVDIGTQTRFSLNSQLIKDIDEMIKEQEESDSDDNSAGNSQDVELSLS